MTSLARIDTASTNAAAPPWPKIALLVAVVLPFAATSNVAAACSLCTCASPRYDSLEEAVTEAFYAADAVFLAEVTGVRTRSGVRCRRVDGCVDAVPNAAGERFAANVVVELQVSSSWKGPADAGGEIAVLTHHQSTACGYMFEVGRAYLVYAYDRDEDGELETNLCARTDLESDAGFDIGVLGSPRGATMPTPGRAAPGAGSSPRPTWESRR